MVTVILLEDEVQLDRRTFCQDRNKQTKHRQTKTQKREEENTQDIVII